MSQSSKKTPASKDAKSAGTRSASLRPGGSPAKFDDSPDMVSSRKKVDTYEKAYALLRSKDWIPEEDRPNLDSMASGLLHLAGHASAPVREALCAFATYTKAISDDQTSNALLAKLGPTIDKIAEATRTWAEETEDEEQRKATELEGVMGRLVAEVSKLSDSQARLVKEMESMGRMRTEFQEVMQKTATATAAAPPPADHRHWGEPPEDGEIQDNDQRRSYADMARRQLPREHAPTIARQERNARQVLVDVKSRADAEGNPLTEQELVEKANRALELMNKDPATYPEGERFTAVSKLREGGLLYETSSARMAKWLLKTDNMGSFTKSFGYEAVIRERGHLVFFRNVPAYFLPSEQAYRSLEKENDWATRSLMTCHWIKPVEKRKRGQLTAHMLVKFRTLKAANAALMYGATVLGRKIKTEKQPKEARRCLKCQRFEPSHLAAHCRGDDTCGTCASTEHKTQDCTATPVEWKCVNCDENHNSHASWDRLCPTFIRASQRLQQADPTSKYRLFPDLEDPTTWELRTEMTDWETFAAATAPRSARPPLRHTPPSQGVVSDDWYRDVTNVLDPPRVERPRSPNRGRPALSSANAVPVATDRSRPQTRNFRRDPSGKRQSTLTKEGGFGRRSPSTARPRPRQSNSSQELWDHYDE